MKKTQERNGAEVAAKSKSRQVDRRHDKEGKRQRKADMKEAKSESHKKLMDLVEVRGSEYSKITI